MGVNQPTKPVQLVAVQTLQTYTSQPIVRGLKSAYKMSRFVDAMTKKFGIDLDNGFPFMRLTHPRYFSWLIIRKNANGTISVIEGVDLYEGVQLSSNEIVFLVGDGGKLYPVKRINNKYLKPNRWLEAVTLGADGTLNGLPDSEVQAGLVEMANDIAKNLENNGWLTGSAPGRKLQNWIAGI